MTHRRRRTLLGLLAAGLVVAAAASLKVGPTVIGVGDIARAIWDGILVREPSGREADIIWSFRIPTLFTALLAGASLGAAGLLMQTYFRNPLAGPDVMGVSAGASLGVAVWTLLWGTNAFVSSLGLVGQVGSLGAATAGAALVLGVALFAARWYDDPLTLLVLGLMFGAAAAGVVGLLVNFAHPERLQSYMQWTLGSFDRSWSRLPAFGWMTAIGLSISMLMVKPLNVLQIGAEHAQSLGLPIARTRFLLLGAAALLTGATTAVCGPIAFLGIVAPHLARLAFRTSDHRWLLPASVIIAAGLAVLVDVAGKSLVLPVNTVSGVLGAPLVIWLVIRLRPR
jgi:iron complex transport system permease protein